jgi:hypothetical protein
MIDMQIINLANYWCEQKDKVNLLQLSRVLSHDVVALSLKIQTLTEKTVEEDLLEE